MTWFAFLLFLQREVAGKEVAPQSWGAWVALLTGGGSFLILLFDRIVGRGKSLQGLDGKIERLCEEVAEMKETQEIMDKHLSSLSKHVQELTHEWRGVDGKNGWKSIVRSLRHDVSDIQKRNLQIDAVSQYEQDQLRKHGKKPERLRDKLSEDADDN